jgi:hypothetical protein
MVSKRAKKAKKRAQREARRQTRRARSGTDGYQQPANVPEPVSTILTAPEELAPYMAPDVDLSTAEKIGYMAYDGHDFLRKNGECIVAASAAQMQRTAIHVFPDTRVVIRGLTFEEIYVLMEGMGEAFCFDQESYDRFVEEAQNRRMAVGDLQNKDLHLLFPEWEWAVEP